MRRVDKVRSATRNRSASAPFVVGLVALVVLGAPPLAAATFVVDSTTDSIDAAPGNGNCADAGGDCTLRAAIMEANALAGADEISLPAGVYTITIAGTNEDGCLTGDFDVTDTTGQLTITGAGIDATFIDANYLDRVFDIQDSVSLAVHQATVRNGGAGQWGAGFQNKGFSQLELEDVVLTGASNYPGGAGGVKNSGGTVTMTRVTISGNTSAGNPAINNQGFVGWPASLTMVDCSIVNNYSQDMGYVAITNSGYHNYVDNGIINMTNVTISGNTGNTPRRIVIRNASGGRLNLNNVTITNNSALGIENQEPTAYGVGGKVYIKNSIVAGNTGFGDCEGTYLSEGYNLIQDTTTGSCTISGDTTGNIVGSAPLLASLADNGGTTLTHLPLEFSPAIDAANPAVPGSGGNACVATDQRGVSRPQDGDGDFTALCDMGAVEIEPPPLYPDLALTKDDGLVSTVPGNTISYTLSFTNTGNGDAFGVVITDTVPANTTFNAGASTANWVCVPDINAGSVCSLTIGTVSAAAADTAFFAVTVDDPVVSGVTEIANTASIADDGTGGIDPTPGDNSDSDTTTVSAFPDFAIDKDDGGASPAPGDTVVYTLSFANNGDQGADGVVLSDTVPDNTVFDPVMSTPGWSCTPDNQAGSECTFAAGSLAGGGAGGAADFAVIIDNPTPPGVSHISNTASITDDWLNGSDLNPTDNTDTVVTPFETIPPTVDNVDTDIGTGDGTLEDCESANGIPIMRLMVTFNEPVRDPPGDTDPDDVTNPANYLIVGAGPDFELDTTVCGGVLGDDVEAMITGVGYDAGTYTATIQLDAVLEPSVFRLLVCGSTSIVDLAGNPLDGDGNGTGGDDFALGFRADPTNLLANGHLDCGLGGWTINETIPSSVTASTVDADDSTLSGSALVSNTSATGVTESFSLGQCLAVGPTLLYSMSRVIRLDADPGITLTVSLDCEYFDTAGCGGVSLGFTQDSTPIQDTSGLWEYVQQSGVTPTGAVSAMCRSGFETADGSVFDAWIDQLAMEYATFIFADGFESGSTNAWSNQAP